MILIKHWIQGAQNILDRIIIIAPATYNKIHIEVFLRNPFTCTLGPFIFSSLYIFWPFSIPRTKTTLGACGILGRDQIIVTMLYIDPMHSLNLNFLDFPICAFPLVKVRAYVYTLFVLWTCMYMLLWQGEHAYTT